MFWPEENGYILDGRFGCTVGAPFSYSEASLTLDRRGVAVYLGRDIAKLKSKGGKWKYCSEEQMLEVASKFIPYR